MKTKNITNLFFALGIFALASCADNDVYNPDNAQKTENLKVPANFSWTTTHTTTCSITSPVNTQVSIYSDKECKDNHLLAEISLNKDEAREVTLDLPTSSTAFYVKYPTENGYGTLPVNVATTRADLTLVLPEEAKGFEEVGNYSYTYFPAKETYGTLLFEDLFPEKGDYDFNDFVAGYNICQISSPGNPGAFNDGIVIKLQIRAIGGTLPYQLGIELTPLQTKYAREYTFETSNNDIEIELISIKDEDPAVFVIKNTNILKDGSFYNTKKVSDTSMPEIKLSIIRNNFGDGTAATQFSNLATPYATNFFLLNTRDNQEIHLKGYPTTKFASNPDAIFNTADNFVWGMKIPVLIPHATEETDIVKAYPKFASWVTSGGKNDKDWYASYVESNVINPTN